MKKDNEKHLQQKPSRLVLKRETLRKLRPEDLEAAGGGYDIIVVKSIRIDSIF